MNGIEKYINFHQAEIEGILEDLYYVKLTETQKTVYRQFLTFWYQYIALENASSPEKKLNQVVDNLVRSIHDCIDR